MTPEEVSKCRVLAEQQRRARRLIEQLQAENAALKAECEALRSAQSKAARLFDLDSECFFAIVHQNYRLKSQEPRVQVFYPCAK